MDTIVKRPRGVPEWVARQQWTGDPKVIREVADAIEGNRRHFDMERWFGARGTYQDSTVIKALRRVLRHPDEPNTCGTSACIAGWAVALHPVRARNAAMAQDGSWWDHRTNPLDAGSVPDMAIAVLRATDGHAWRGLFMSTELNWRPAVTTLRYIADRIEAER